ncbi:DUF6270 domain-containing protein [Romboutsia sp.]
MNEIIILGSCVSIDIFNFSNDFKINEYFPRTTLSSVFGEKFNDLFAL